MKPGLAAHFMQLVYVPSEHTLVLTLKHAIRDSTSATAYSLTAQSIADVINDLG